MSDKIVYVKLNRENIRNLMLSDAMMDKLLEVAGEHGDIATQYRATNRCVVGIVHPDDAILSVAHFK